MFLGKQISHVFANAKGVLRVALDLPKETLDSLLTQIMMDAYEMAGYRFCGAENSQRTTHLRDCKQKIAVGFSVDGYFMVRS